MASNSQSKRRTLIGWFSVGILQYGTLPWERPLSVFFPCPRKFNLSKTKRVFKKRNFIFSSQQNNYSKRNLVLYVKGYRSKFAEGRRRLRTFTKRRSVRSLKEMTPYNKQLTNLTCSGPYWGFIDPRSLFYGPRRALSLLPNPSTALALR